MCNRGRSCQASAEPLASYAEPPPTEGRMPKCASAKLSSLIHTVHSLLAVYHAATYIDNPSKPPSTAINCRDCLRASAEVRKRPLHLLLQQLKREALWFIVRLNLKSLLLAGQTATSRGSCVARAKLGSPIYLSRAIINKNSLLHKEGIVLKFR